MVTGDCSRLDFLCYRIQTQLFTEEIMFKRYVQNYYHMFVFICIYLYLNCL